MKLDATGVHFQTITKWIRLECTPAYMCNWEDIREALLVPLSFMSGYLIIWFRLLPWCFFYSFRDHPAKKWDKLVMSKWWSTIWYTQLLFKTARLSHSVYFILHSPKRLVSKQMPVPCIVLVQMFGFKLTFLTWIEEVN